MKVDLTSDPMTAGYRLSAYMSAPEIADTRGAIVRRAVELVAEKLAEQFLHDHGADILAKLDPQAIANLAIADSGASVRESLEKQIPREVQHHYHHDREVYKVGLFGGVSRVR